jgi:hypothetical protein
MRQQEYILTRREANLLAVFQGPTVGLSQLAAATQLTPSEVREVLAHLADKRLATLQEGWAQLTEEGLYVCDLLRQQARQQARQQPYLPTYPRVVIVPDQSAAERRIETRSEEELDRAIAAELEKLKGYQ